MGLPWIRLDSDIASHDKIVLLLSDPSAKRWQAASSYMFALGWSGGHGTDGLVPKAALAHVHGTPATARLLEKYDLWTPDVRGWQIKNFVARQETSVVSAGKRAAQRAAANRTNCIRYHGPNCGCWRVEAENAGGLVVLPGLE